MAFNRETYKPRDIGARRVGMGLPVSVSTAIPLEDKIVIESPEPKMVAINLKTLFRNFWSSYSNLQRPNLLKMLPEWIEEASSVQTLITSTGVRCFYYYPDYSDFKVMFPEAELYEAKTAKQRAYASAEQLAMKALAKEEHILAVRTGSAMVPIKEDTMVISHMAIDMLSRSSFKSLKLLESNTAAVKEWNVWGSKLNTKHPGMPFNPFTLCVFGDGKSVKGLPINVRRAVEEVAKKRRWNPTTTMAKIHANIRDDVEKELRPLLSRLAIRKFNTTVKAKPLI